VSDPIRILLVEDEPAHASLVRRYLAAVPDPTFDVTWVERLAPALERLRHDEPDVVLLDLGLPDSGAKDTLARVLAETDAAVIVLTTSDDRDEAIAAVRAGAQDHLPKPRINADLLARSVSYAIERKRAELERKQFHDTLEARVAERSAVAEKRARMLRRLAVELTHTERRERRRLAQLLHDDLQQLLVAARMRLESLASRTTRDDDRAVLEQASELLNQSIEVSRSLTLDLFPPVLQERGLGAALEWLGRRMGKQHRLDVSVRSDGDATRFSEDMASLLLEAARELLFNVVKHSGVDRAEVVLDCSDPDRCRLTVRDEGQGLEGAELADRPRHTERFGLFSIEERLEAVGGALAIASDRGAGCTIVLTAPYDAHERPVERAPWEPRFRADGREPLAAPAALDAGGGSIRVLVVDDHDVVRQGLVAAIEAQPDLHVVDQAEDGLVALDLLERTSVDVVVMDVTMPRLDGLETTRRIKAKWPGVRVIGLSMHEPEDMQRAMEAAGASTYISKSLPTETLLEAIRRAGRREPA
jgi:DNA-binding NarL/FixJ family response regulator